MMKCLREKMRGERMNKKVIISIVLFIVVVIYVLVSTAYFTMFRSLLCRFIYDGLVHRVLHDDQSGEKRW